ncbi:unnamed protein product [Leuciscus chuanchicus]
MDLKSIGVSPRRAPPSLWYGTFRSKLSSYIFEWDQEDVKELKVTKRGEWESSHGGQAPTEAQLMANISPGQTGEAR